jgi:hypothetical protein
MDKLHRKQDHRDVVHLPDYGYKAWDQLYRTRYVTHRQGCCESCVPRGARMSKDSADKAHVVEEQSRLSLWVAREFPNLCEHAGIAAYVVDAHRRRLFPARS